MALGAGPGRVVSRNGRLAEEWIDDRAARRAAPTRMGWQGRALGLVGTCGPRVRGQAFGRLGGGRLGEASLPDVPGLDLVHRQQAVGGDTLVRHDAEQLARRQAGVFHEHPQVGAPR